MDRITENWRPMKRTGLSWAPWAFIDWVMKHLGMIRSPDGTIDVMYGESEGIELSLNEEGLRPVIKRVVNNIYNDLDDTYKVKHSSADATPDYLTPQLKRYPGYSATQTQFFMNYSGTVQWVKGQACTP